MNDDTNTDDLTFLGTETPTLTTPTLSLTFTTPPPTTSTPTQTPIPQFDTVRYRSYDIRLSPVVGYGHRIKCPPVNITLLKNCPAVTACPGLDQTI